MAQHHPGSPAAETSGARPGHAPTESPAPAVPEQSTRSHPQPPHDVFMSYSSEDRVFALALAKAVAAHGWSVWIDQWRLLGGQAFRKQIQHAIEQAGAVLVLWSKSAVERDWVAAEAEVGRARGVLVAARKDDISPPLPFSEYQIRDLRGWDGADSNHAGLAELLRDVAQVLKRETLAAPRVKVSVPVVRPWRLLGAMAGTAVALALMLVWLVFRLDLPPAVTFGGPILLALLGFFVRVTGAGAWLRRWLDAWLARPFWVALLLAALGLWCFVTVVVEGPDAEYYPLTNRLTTATAPSTVLREQPLTAQAHRVRWLLPVAPWGRALRVAVEGHAPRAVKLFPWRGASLRLGRELEPRPVLLVRVDRDECAVTQEAELRVEHDGAVLARVVLTNDAAAMLVGGPWPLDSLKTVWQGGLEGLGANAAALCDRWSRPVPAEWANAPPLDARLRAVLKTHSGRELISEPFPMTGAFTDAEPKLHSANP